MSNEIIKESVGGGATGTGGIAVRTDGPGISSKQQQSLQQFLRKFSNRVANKYNYHKVETPFPITVNEAFDIQDVLSRLRGIEGKKISPTDNATYGVEDDKGNVMKITVRKDQAPEFETVLAHELAAIDSFSVTGTAGKEVSMAELLFNLKDKFDIDESIRDYLDLGSREMGEIKYACKMATRPNVQVNYADVNMYNYRFKVATKVDYGSVTLSLYDDNKNLAHNLFLYYLNAISPVSNKPPEQYDLRGDPIQEWASLGPLPESAKFGLIKRMTVTHHYSNTYADDGESSHKSINYHYMNPKIQQFNLDELDMGVGSEASMITLTFVYDSVYTEYDDYKPNVEVLPLEVVNSTNDPLTYVWDGGDPDRPIA